MWERALTAKHSRPAAPGQSLRRHAGTIKQLKMLLSRKRLRDPPKLSEDHLLSILLVRRAREEIFGAGLFADPSWDILLELYAAYLGKRKMSVANLAAAISLPPSTVSRWVAALVEAGITDQPDPDFGWVTLTEAGAAKMTRLASHWSSAFLSI